MEQVGSINVNFSIFSDSLNHIHIMDLSDWVYAEDSPAYLTITTPGARKEKNFVFVKKKINTFNSHNLGLTCLSGDCKEEYIELPDGIYQITLKSSFKDIDQERFYLKTDRFEIEYAKVMVKDGLEYNQDLVLYMTKIKFLLEVAKSHAKLGDFVKSQRFFEESKSLLKKYVECNN